ncbi:MAG: hypothetical protein Q3971_06650 [Moraxella sp.]|nr:hypothetical protein [Moraxella sp.]
MKRLIIIGLLSLCQLSCVYSQSLNPVCVEVVENRVADNIRQTYYLKNDHQNVYFCSDDIKDCVLKVTNTAPTEPYDGDVYWSFIFGHHIDELSELGLDFDINRFAVNYAHSLWLVISVAKDELNYPMSFHDDLLIIDFPKDRYHEIGAYPKGMLRPIEHIFIQEKITKAIIKKHQGKVVEATFTTDKDEHFQYRLSYHSNKLVKSEILFQKSIQDDWQTDVFENYHYIQCPSS